MTKCVYDSLLWSEICRVFSKQLTSLIYVVIMASPSTPKSFSLGRTVTFAGFETAMDYVKPCQKFTEPIANFPMPTNTDDIHSLFDLINQVSYAFALSEKL